MSESGAMILIGVVLMAAAFAVTGVSNSAMPPVTKTTPPTKTFRRVLFGFGVLFATLGIYRLVSS